ncbi:MAG: hypothetical protein P1U57_13635 [Oleibacter sp.]|nr:hypothetical protein [Thalassolituus sp.]
MSDNTTPDTLVPSFLKDALTLLSADGFACGEQWYHGTSSGLVESILANGLKGGGDTELSERTQSTLGTIGNRQFESNDPVFLTQSKELALYWAISKMHTRNLYFQKNEAPVVLAVEIDNASIKSDVGATAILLEPSNDYILTIKSLYEEKGLTWEDVNPLQVDRQFFLNKLAMAYCNKDIPAAQVSVVQA